MSLDINVTNNVILVIYEGTAHLSAHKYIFIQMVRNDILPKQILSLLSFIFTRLYNLLY